MKVISEIEDFIVRSPSLALSVGNFDGLHLGHAALLNRLKTAGEESVVLTFSNHPATVLYKRVVPWITSLEHRLFLFEKMQIDTVILVPFTDAFSKKSPETFLRELKKHLSFSALILGHDAVLGHKRVGDGSHLFLLSETLNFSLEYLEPVQIKGEIVSSSQIRKYLDVGDLNKASALLGRSFSVFGRVIQGTKHGSAKLGFRTANLDVDDLCLPPFGVYAVKVIIQDGSFAGVANLGHAPTLHSNRKSLLEVHILDFEKEIYGQPIEVIFTKYLRAEKRFDSVQALQDQIQKDILLARHLFSYEEASI